MSGPIEWCHALVFVRQGPLRVASLGTFTTENNSSASVRGDRDLLRQASVSAHVEPIHAGVLSLVKAEIPDLHEFPFRAIEDRLNLWSIELPRVQMPRRFRLFRHRDLTHW